MSIDDINYSRMSWFSITPFKWTSWLMKSQARTFKLRPLFTRTLSLTYK